jgi:hypothetical protein
MVAQTKRSTGTKIVSKLMLVDLAGSEALKQTGAVGAQLEEAKVHA